MRHRRFFSSACGHFILILQKKQQHTPHQHHINTTPTPCHFTTKAHKIDDNMDRSHRFATHTHRQQKAVCLLCPSQVPQCPHLCETSTLVTERWRMVVVVQLVSHDRPWAATGSGCWKTICHRPCGGQSSEAADHHRVHGNEGRSQVLRPLQRGTQEATVDGHHQGNQPAHERRRVVPMLQFEIESPSRSCSKSELRGTKRRRVVPRRLGFLAPLHCGAAGSVRPI